MRKITITGVVVSGKGLGHTVGMPTANIQWDGQALPPMGVYAGALEIDGKKHLSVTNIGRRPTVDDEETVTVETYLPDFDRKINGRRVTLELHARLRDTKKFHSLREVKMQVEKDVERAREIVGGGQNK